jgi:hypothetical protein
MMRMEGRRNKDFLPAYEYYPSIYDMLLRKIKIVKDNGDHTAIIRLEIVRIRCSNSLSRSLNLGPNKSHTERI